MRWLLAAAAAALTASCVIIEVPAEGGGGTAAPPASAPPAATPPRGGGQGLVQQMADAANAHRRSARCPELAWMPAVARAAQAHADDMARRDYFNHRSPEGQGPSDRLRAQGVVSYRALAENIAQHPGTVREVLAGWVASPGHRENLEECGYTHHGVGLRDGFWVHVFLTPPPPATPAPGR